MTKDTGGQAFPVHPDISLEKNHEWAGMTLRDWFAGQALTTVLGTARPENDKGTPIEVRCATFAYRLADAMIAERSRG